MSALFRDWLDAYRHHPKYLILNLILWALQGLDAVVQVFLLTRMIDAYQAGEMSIMLRYVFAFAGFLALKGLYAIFYSALVVPIRAHIDAEKAREWIQVLSGFSYPAFENPDALDQIALVEEHYIQGFARRHSYISSALRTLTKIASLFFIFWRAVSWHAWVYPAMLALVIVLVKKTGDALYAEEADLADAKRKMEYAREILRDRAHAHERTLYGFSAAFAERYAQAKSAYTRRKGRCALRNVFLLEAGDLPIMAGMLFLLWGALVRVRTGAISIGFFLSLLTQSISFLEILRYDLSYSLEDLLSSMRYARSYAKLRRMYSATSAGAASDDLPASASIVCRDLTFAYPGTSRDVLCGVHLTIAPGERVMLAGENGSGKTTLSKLLLGLYDNYTGTITIGGIDLRSLSPKARRQMLGAMFQDYGRYYLDLRDNAALAEPARDPEDAIRRFGLQGIPRDVVLRLYGESGLDLSGGQWQRIALARLAHARRPIALLDEPTSALDPIEESKLYSALSSIFREQTTLLVSHRLGLAQAVDRILVLKDGRIVEDGTHAELLESGGHYANMYEKQRGLYHAEV